MQDNNCDENIFELFMNKMEKQYKWSDDLIMIQSHSEEFFLDDQVEKKLEATPQRMFKENYILENQSKHLEADQQKSPISTVKTECKKSVKKQKSKTGCLCKKTQCMKSYCECYSNGKGCSKLCKCLNCKNLEDRKQVQPKIEGDMLKKQLKCKCKKSQCMKKYCECFSAGMICGIECSCNGCENVEKPISTNSPSETQQVQNNDQCLS